jgi:hypothetical protein
MVAIPPPLLPRQMHGLRLRGELRPVQGCGWRGARQCFSDHLAATEEGLLYAVVAGISLRRTDSCMTVAASISLGRTESYTAMAVCLHLVGVDGELHGRACRPLAGADRELHGRGRQHLAGRTEGCFAALVNMDQALP